MVSPLTPISFIFCSLIFSSSSGSLPHTRLPTVAVPLTIMGIGHHHLGRDAARASILPMSAAPS